jgi:hypothetical protein
MPDNEQPYATIVTKDYPGDELSRLGNGRWRINVHVGRDRVAELTGDGSAEPGEATIRTLRELLREAYRASRARHERRSGEG